MKHYKEVGFCQIWNVKPTCTNVNSPYWILSGNGSGKQYSWVLTFLLTKLVTLPCV